MTYQQVLTILKAANLAVNPNGKFANARRPDGTFDFEGPYPIVNLRAITKKTNRRENFVTWNITLLFFKEDSAQNPVSIMEQNQFDMDNLQENFLENLYQNSKLQIENETAIPEHRVPGGKVSGFGVNFTMITRYVCPIIEEEE